MGLPITLSASFLFSYHHYSRARITEVLICSTSSLGTQPLALDSTSAMSRDLQNQQGYHGDRRLPKPQMSNGSVYSTDPARYDSGTANSDGWYGQCPLREPLPFEGKGQLEPARNYRYIPPNLQTTSPYGGNTGRSVQSTRHFSRSEERASERHGPTAHGAPKPRRSGGRGSEHSGERGKNPTSKKHSRNLFVDSSFHKGITHPDASHASTSKTLGKLPPRWYHYSEQEQIIIIECVKARMNWHEISENLERSHHSVKTHWYNVLTTDHRARGVKYNPVNKHHDL